MFFLLNKPCYCNMLLKLTEHTVKNVATGITSLLQIYFEKNNLHFAYSSLQCPIIPLKCPTVPFKCPLQFNYSSL